jgi:signal peptidase II
MRERVLSQTKWNIIVFAIALLVVVADQISKWWIQNHFVLGQSVPADGFFRLTYVQNTGAAFSIFGGHTDILSVISILGVVLLLAYIFIAYRRYAFLNTRLNRVALGLLLGGDIGNLTDRLRLGYVRDFVDIGAWPVFNVADSCIDIGIILLAISILFSSRNIGPENHS